MNIHHASLRAVSRATHKRGSTASFRRPRLLRFLRFPRLPRFPRLSRFPSLPRLPLAPLALAFLAVALLPFFVTATAIPVRAADVVVSGGSGGGGGGGDGAFQESRGGRASHAGGGAGGQGGYGASGSGNAGGGGGASRIDVSATSDTARNGGNASDITPGAAGAIVNIGENMGFPGSAPSGNVGGAGGNGGSPTVTSFATSADEILVYGGNGGRGGQGGTASGHDGGNGGDGGSASLTLTVGNMDVSGNVYVNSGEGGGGARSSVGDGTSGIGGRGGDASLTTTGALRANTVYVANGGNGDTDGYGSENPGASGDVGFFANSLTAQYIQLMKNPGGNLAFNINTLDVTSGDTTLGLDRTTAGAAGTSMGGDGVYIGTARLGDGQLQIIPVFDPGSAFIDTLQLEGRGTFTDTDNPVTVGSLTVDGGTLHDGNWSSLIERTYATTTAITLGVGGATVELDAGQDKTLARNLTGAGGLTKTGGGTLTLAGANDYTGNTTVAAGTLEITGVLGTYDPVESAATSKSVYIYNGNIASNGTLVFNQTDVQDIQYLNGVVSGTGDLIINGAETSLLFRGANTYTGWTIVNGGELLIETQGRASDKLALHDGAHFNTGGVPNPFWNGAAAQANLARLDVHGSARWTGNLNVAGGAVNFHVPPSMANGATMLAVSGGADIAGATVNVGIEGASSPLQAGESIVLIDAAGALTGLPSGATANGQGMQGVTLEYEFNLTTTANQLLATVSGPGPAVNDQSKSLSEGYLASTAFLTQGGDFLAGQGLRAAKAALTAAAAADATPRRPQVFVALGGGNLKHKTGSHVDSHADSHANSHVDVKGYTLAAGVAKGFSLTGAGAGAGASAGTGDATLAALFEYGKGDYTSHGSFASGKVRGEGGTDYKGLGVIGRFDFTNAVYLEGSARGGQSDTDYRSDDLRDGTGNAARYDAKSSYVGAHIGGGKLWMLNKQNSLDVHAQFLWTHQGKETVTLSTGDRVAFEAINSERVKLGAKFRRAFLARLSGYAGIACEHEFSGKARARETGGGLNIDAPDLKGVTTMIELGLTGRPSAIKPLYLDFGIQGHAGNREGITASFRVEYGF